MEAAPILERRNQHPAEAANRGFHPTRRREHMLWFIFLAVLWIAIAFWPARVAARKGHSFFLFFLFSLVFFPLALLVAYMVSDRSVAAATA
jgi:hypothetical protein